MPVHAIVAVCLFIGCCTISLTALHWQLHGVVSAVQVALAIFCSINLWVCVCEMALLLYCTDIKKAYEAHNAKLGAGKLPPIFLFEQITLRQVFSLRYWGVSMWATYSVLDPSYTDSTSFGWCVDVGNGFVTFLPTIIFAVGMTTPVLPARWLGMLGLVKFYQELYGTVIYFFQYFINRRFNRTPWSHTLGIVLPCNGIWLALPALGMYVSARLILSGQFEVFGQH